MSTPSSLSDIRRFFNTLDLKNVEADIARETRAAIAILGPVNSGKSTLFNKLKGAAVSPVSAVPGTTTKPVAETFGPFRLIDTPGMGEARGVDRAKMALQAAGGADLIVLLLDAGAGIRQSDLDLHANLSTVGPPVVVALNKIDLVRHDWEAVLHDAEVKLGVPVIPISAKTGTGLAKDLIPAIIDAHPRLAVTIGRALPAFRGQASQRIVRESTFMAALVGAEPIPAIDIPLLVGVQVRMILRLAAIHGEAMNVQRARELITAIGGGIAIRYAAQEVAKLVPAAGWVAGGAVAASGTWALGKVIHAYFRSGKTLTTPQMREMYSRLRRTVRRNAEGDEDEGEA
jgi:small GTP-binding protein